jgi:hypothetical protein
MEPLSEHNPKYVSYLLRLRWAWRDGEPVCQAMLRDVSDRSEQRFADLESLFAYLRAQGPDTDKGLVEGRSRPGPGR